MMSEWKLVDVEGIGSGYACLTLDGVSTTKSRNLIQADRGAGGDGLGFSDLGTLLIDYADRDIATVKARAIDTNFFMMILLKILI